MGMLNSYLPMHPRLFLNIHTDHGLVKFRGPLHRAMLSQLRALSNDPDSSTNRQPKLRDGNLSCLSPHGQPHDLRRTPHNEFHKVHRPAQQSRNDRQPRGPRHFHRLDARWLNQQTKDKPQQYRVDV